MQFETPSNASIFLSNDLLLKLKAVNVAPGSSGIMGKVLPVDDGHSGLLQSDPNALTLTTSELQMHNRKDRI